MNSELFQALRKGGSPGAPELKSVTAPAGPGVDPLTSPTSGSPLFMALQHLGGLQPGPMVAENSDPFKGLISKKSKDIIRQDVKDAMGQPVKGKK